jgi:hypothetical protein
MVYYSTNAEDDFIEIIKGMATAEKFSLDYKFAMQNLSDIRKEMDNICIKGFHQNCNYGQHNYRKKIHICKWDTRFQWYIIYDWNEENKIACVLKILNNYLAYQ